MINRDAGKINHVVRDALRQTNNRGIILSGWGGVKNRSSDGLFILNRFHMIGCCRAARWPSITAERGLIRRLRTEIPNIVVPFTADQPFWGNRGHVVGVGPKSILVKNPSVERLAQAIARAESNVFRKRGQAIGQEIRDEDGVNDAVELIEAYAFEFKINVDSVF